MHTKSPAQGLTFGVDRWLFPVTFSGGQLTPNVTFRLLLSFFSLCRIMYFCYKVQNRTVSILLNTFYLI